MHILQVLAMFFLSTSSRAFVSRNLSFHRRNVLIRSMASSSSVEEEQLMQDMLYRIRRVNHMPDEIRKSLLDFQVDGKSLGKIRPKVAEMLCELSIDGNPPVFELLDKPSEDTFLTLSSSVGTSVEERTKSVASVMEKLRQDGVIRGWRNEMYPVSESFYSPPLFLMERAAVTVLGALEYGVHINGLVQESRNDQPKMWIARRSPTKSNYPGMLDHIVAGGQPANLGLLENCIKECEEEANIPEGISRDGVQAAGAISYEVWDPKTDKVSRVVLFNYDLYLPPDFQPKPVDGEVEGFFLWSMDQVKESIAKDYDDPIKPNCYVVIIDYLLRTGQVSPEAPGYLDVLRELRSGDCK